MLSRKAGLPKAALVLVRGMPFARHTAPVLERARRGWKCFRARDRIASTSDAIEQGDEPDNPHRLKGRYPPLTVFIYSRLAGYPQRSMDERGPQAVVQQDGSWP
jgi:hypothetical protein